MADLIASQFSPASGLRSAFRSDEEDAALAQMQADEAMALRDSALGQGILRGMHQTPAMLANAFGQVVEPFSLQYSKPVFDWASEQNKAAQSIYSPAPQSYDQINGIGDAVNYVTGAIGENIPNTVASIPLGIGGRIGMRGLAMAPAAKNLAATSLAAFPMQMGEMAGSMREDQAIMENTTPLGRLGVAAGYGALTAPLEGADEALLMGRAMGAGGAVKNIFKDGVKATVKDATAHVPKAIPEAALTEGIPEAAQTGIQQKMLSGVNPNRDTSGDANEMADAFFKGWAAGTPTSAVGRGSDVAWAQGRGATEAIRGLLQRKVLPDSLKDSDDRSVLDWDDQDNAQRNSWAKDMADRIMDSDAAQSLKDAAASFYDKASAGAGDAWRTMSDALGVEEKVGRAREGVEHFLGSIKKANQAAFGKANAESDPLDQAMYDNFSQYLDPKGASARDTELKSRLFNGVKEALLDDDWHNLPWNRLEDEFGTIGRATDAVLKLRENLVRAGKLEHDDEFGKLFEATIKDGQQGERAMMDVLARYGRDYIKRKPTDSELRDVVRGMRRALTNPEWMRKNKTAFDAEMKKQFGSNAEKVIAALAPKNNVEAGIETEAENVDDTTGQTFKAKSAEEFTPGTRFIGSGVKGLRKQVASNEPGQNIVANHGGFWSLGHSDPKTRSEIQARFKDTAADLRKDGHYVRELSPLDYAVEAGVSIRKVARHVIGTKAIAGMTDEQVREALKDHPARMLAVDERDMEKDKVSLDKDDLLNLSDKLKASFSAFDKGMPVPDKELRGKIAVALGKTGAEQRKAMAALGLEHGVKLRLGKNGAYLENNPRHSGNGVFMVKMKDGTVHYISAQQLISLMRERGKGQFGSRSAYDMFNSGLAALMSIDGVETITAQDVWGNEDTEPFDLKKNKKGKWNNYFQLEPGMTLNDARKASRRGQFRDKVMEELEAAYEEAVASGDEDSIEQAQQDIDDELADRAAFQDQLEGEGQREAAPGIKGATTKNLTPTEHAREPVLDFNDDGTPKHPYGKPVDHEQTQHLEFNGVPMRVRAGVSGRHFTEGARKVIAVAKALQKIKNSPTFTNSRMDMALDLVARSAAAQKDGNVEARDAAIFAAADAIRQAALDEIEIAQGLGETKAVDKLTDLAARVIDLAAQYDPAKHDALLAEYAPKAVYKKKTVRESDVKEKREVIKAKAPTKHIQLKNSDPFQKARDDLQGKVDTHKAMADEARARAKAEKAWMELSEEERTAHVDTASKPVEEALSNLGKLSRSYAGLVKNVKQALGTLKEAWVNGELDKAELIKNLRDAVAALKAVAGDAVNVVRDAAQKFVAEYKKAIAEKSAAVEKLNEESIAAEGSFANGKGVTQAELDAAKDYVAKVLGPKVKVELAKALGGNSAAWNRVNSEVIIRIAANASNPLSKAHHEAMHEFFQRLMDAHPEAAEVLRTAANSPLVKRQIEQFFHSDANYAKIKAAIANDEHERVAYMFQLWAAGKLNVGPKTQNWFQKVKGFLQKAFGMLSNDQKAEAIMQSFHDGMMSEPNAVAQVLAGNQKTVESLLDRAGEWAEPIANTAREIFYTAQNMLSESDNKGFQNIGKLFSTETGATSQEMSFMDAKVMKTNQMNDRLWSIIKDADEKDIAAALEGLQRGETSKDADIAKIQQRMRKFLDQMHDYATAAGVEMKKLDDYFPRVWDAIAIAENKSKFVEMLKADHFKNTGKPLDDTVAIGIAENLIRNRGHEPVNEEELSNGYSPFMASANKRVLDFVKSPEFSEFQEKSLESIMSTYIAQLVHKAEYTRRFGSNGDKLRDMVIDAVGEEVGPEWATAKKAAQAKLDALKASYKGKPKADLTKKLAELGYRYGGLEVRHVADELSSAEAKTKFSDFEPKLRRSVRAIMAMEGTLGAEINPALRKWSAGLMVYENLRLLGMSLFSQVIDPLGVMVRGGTVGDAWGTFKRGIAGTIAGWRGKPIEDSATKLAMQLGIIDVGGWMNSQGNAYTSLYMGKTAQKWNDRLFRWNGVEGFSQGTRVGATLAAVAFLKYHSTLPSEHSARWLEELNVTPADLKLTNGELDYTNPKVQQAIFRWVEGAILRPNASMRPSWASDPHMALLFHLKQFTYAMQKVLLERVFNEAKHGNMDPAITMVLTYVPTMIAADFLRGIVANGGQEPPWKRDWDFGDYLVEGVQRAGLLGVPQFALDTAKWGPAELAGPVAEQIAKAGKTYYKDLEKDSELDKVAGYTQAVRDIERAEQFDGLEHATKKTLRDALPMNSLTKRYVYDELVN